MDDLKNSLLSTLNNLVHASSEEETQQALEDMREILQNPHVTDSDRSKARCAAVESLRSDVLQFAQEAYAKNPLPFPERTPGVFEELATLRSTCSDAQPRTEDFNLVEDIVPMLNGFSQCESPQSVHTLVQMVSGYLEEHPDLREAGYRRLVRALEDEVLANYLPLSLYAMSQRPKAVYLTSLLVALEDDTHYAYTLDFLDYENGVFSCITPEALATEKDVARLQRKLEVVQNAARMANPIFYEGYFMQLKDEILERFLAWLDAHPDTYDLPEDVHTCIGLLRQVMEEALLVDDDVDEEDKGDLYPLSVHVSALHYIHALGCQQDPAYLVNDWMELQRLVAKCPACREGFSEQTAFTLVSHILTGTLASGNMPLPSQLETLLRFYMPLCLSTNRAINDDETLDWVLDVTA